MRTQIGPIGRDSVTLPTSLGVAKGENGQAAKANSAEATKHQDLQNSIHKLQDKIAEAHPSYLLEAGLDPNGGHPNQVLIQLSDKVTKQVFFSYYLPASQVAKAANSENPVGLLLQNKA
ncbi:hypothetical protein [Candidatus Igneacidithiobacillus taiwanensis]|uniref:hypothetical protein n=1 Tax=Candidatus Igneacidithiobacillus taiwanensis TaxID=1945924 RepID=UPI0028A031B6|nr:hypothetical protein [Candidatus Igneacidithiobacillus taiwanensis]